MCRTGSVPALKIGRVTVPAILMKLSELALAHVNSDETRAAYARDMLIEPRRRLMDDWADYCGIVQESSGDVVEIGRATA